MDSSSPQVTGNSDMKSRLKGKPETMPLTGNTMPLTEAFMNFQITQRVTGGARLAVNGNVKLPVCRASLGSRGQSDGKSGFETDVIISSKNGGIVLR